MNNILVGLKRFLKNKNTVTILALLVSLGILYWAYNYRIKKATDPIVVPYATRELQPRTLITSEMVGSRKVPGSMVTANVITSNSSIVGKYVSNQVDIPKGSLFYTNAVVEWEDMPTSVYANIPEGYTVVSLPVSLESTYGNSIYPGNYIDLYFATENESGKLLLGKLIESIEVLSVFDGEGNNVFEKSSDVKAPSYLVFSVPEDMHLLLRKASYLSGTIFPVPRSAEYSTNPKSTSVSSDYLKNYILAQTVDVAEKDLGTLSPDDIVTNNTTVENGGNE